MTRFRELRAHLLLQQLYQPGFVQGLHHMHPAAPKRAALATPVIEGCAVRSQNPTLTCCFSRSTSLVLWEGSTRANTARLAAASACSGGDSSSNSRPVGGWGDEAKHGSVSHKHLLLCRCYSYCCCCWLHGGCTATGCCDGLHGFPAHLPAQRGRAGLPAAAQSAGPPTLPFPAVAKQAERRSGRG